MNAKDFIEEKLHDIATNLFGVQIRYEFRNSTRSHIIEIRPISIFEENAIYREYESNIEAEFEQLFPEENIVFISEGSLTQIKKIDLEIGTDNINIQCNTIIVEFEVTGYNDLIRNEPSESYALAA